MTQHVLFANPNRQMRPAYPFVVTLQAGIVDGETQVVAPLILLSTQIPKSRLLPIVGHGGTNHAVTFGLITHLSSRFLRRPIGSIAHYRDDLSRALDWLFFGI